MAVPGSSSVYYGGSVAYNTRKAKKLLLDDAALHQRLVENNSSEKSNTSTSASSEAEAYIQSKLFWTAETSKAFCDSLETDYAIAEGGASGPTFRPNDLHSGFAVISIAGKDRDTNKTRVLAQS
ncbi:MAG: hypothetical protein SGARI_007768, partial [Bacillariaceae sp.]